MKHLAYRCVWHTGWSNKHQTKFSKVSRRFVIDFLKIINYNQISHFVYIFQFPLSCCGYPVSKLCWSKFKVNPRSGLACTHDWILFLHPPHRIQCDVKAMFTFPQAQCCANWTSVQLEFPQVPVTNGMHWQTFDWKNQYFTVVAAWNSTDSNGTSAHWPGRIEFSRVSNEFIAP